MDASEDENKVLENNFSNKVMEPASDIQETTSFTADANVIEAGGSEVISLPTAYKSQFSATKSDEIKNFLARPIRFFAGSFTVTDSGVLTTRELMKDVINNPMIYNKLIGFGTIKAKMRFRLTVNANRFQQGRYIMAYVPRLSKDVPDKFFNMRKFSLTQITQLPHVQLDLGTATQAILEIPWMHVQLAEVISNGAGLGQTGQLLIGTYSPLVAPTGATTAPYYVYASLHDVELGAPSLMAQSSWTPRSRMRTSKNKKMIARIDPSEAELEEASLGPITGTLQKVSKASNLLSTVPLLSAVAGPVGWAADIAAGVASIFGWSKPTDLSEVTRAVQTVQPFANNCDMPDQSMPLSLFARNRIEVMPGLAATDIDEMSIDYLKTIPAFSAIRTWNVSTAVGTKFYDTPLSIFTFERNISGVFLDAPYMFIARQFQYWRGSLRIKLIFVKTEFHSGRLTISFNPFYGLSSATIDNPDYVMKEVIDIRTGTEFDITIPYISHTPWVSVSSFVGQLIIEVTNPLTAPASVSSSISMIVETSAGPDWEVAFPRPFKPILLGRGSLIPQSSWNPVKVVTNIKQGELSYSKNYDDENYSSRYCIGEKVLSINSLLKSCKSIVSPSASIGFNLIPHSIQVEFVAEPISYTNVPLEYWSMCYGMIRGSVRVKAWNDSTTSGYVFTNLLPQGTSVGYVATANTITASVNNQTSGLGLLQGVAFRAGLETQTPFYSDTHALNPLLCATNTVQTVNGTITGAPGVSMEVSTTSSRTWVIGKYAGDDWQMSLFCCIPPYRL
nr:MAG: capsid protein [Chemarfal virus 180]